MSATATYYTYDKSHRMKSQYILGGEAHYYSYNERNMVASIQDVGGPADFMRYFVYNGVGERVIVTDNTTHPGLPAYWAYDGRKLLQDKQVTAGTPALSNYRHNDTDQDCPLGSLIEEGLNDATGPAFPVLDGAGSVTNVQDPADGVNDSFVANASMEQIAGADNFKTRLRAFSPWGMIRGQTTQEIYYMRRGGARIPSKNIVLGGARKRRARQGDGASPAPTDNPSPAPPTSPSPSCPSGSDSGNETPCCGPDITGLLIHGIEDAGIRFFEMVEAQKNSTIDNLFDTRIGMGICHDSNDRIANLDIAWLTNPSGEPECATGQNCWGTVALKSGATSFCFNYRKIEYVMQGFREGLCRPYIRALVKFSLAGSSLGAGLAAAAAALGFGASFGLGSLFGSGVGTASTTPMLGGALALQDAGLGGDEQALYLLGESLAGRYWGPGPSPQSVLDSLLGSAFKSLRENEEGSRRSEKNCPTNCQRTSLAPSLIPVWPEK